MALSWPVTGPECHVSPVSAARASLGPLLQALGHSHSGWQSGRTRSLELLEPAHDHTGKTPKVQSTEKSAEEKLDVGDNVSTSASSHTWTFPIFSATRGPTPSLSGILLGDRGARIRRFQTLSPTSSRVPTVQKARGKAGTKTRASRLGSQCAGRLKRSSLWDYRSQLDTPDTCK